MSAQPSFRSSFNGFNREDVVNYIEYLNTKHTAELNKMNSELDYLRTRPTQSPAVDTDDLEETIAQQAARIRELFDRCKQLEEELAAAQADQADTNRELPAAEVPSEPAIPPVSFKSRMEDELEAYRRAERTERYARERAEQMYQQVNGALADAAAKVDDTARHVGLVTDKVVAQLAELQDAVTESKQVLREAAATMYTIRPYGEEN